MDAIDLQRLTGWLDRRRWWFFLLIVAVYAAGFNGQWRITSDSALHATVARNLVEGEGFTDPSGYAQQLHPGLAWIMAGSFQLTGGESLLPAIVLVWLIALATLATLYQWARLYAGPGAAIIVLLLIGLSKLFYGYSFDLLTDIPFLLGLALLLLGSEMLHHRTDGLHRPILLILIGVVIMGLFRSVVLVAAVAAAGAMLIHVARRGRGWQRAAGMGLVLAALVLIFVLVVDPAARHNDVIHALSRLSEGPSFWIEHIRTQSLPYMMEKSLPIAAFGIELGPGIDTAISLVLLGLALALGRSRPLMALLTLAFVAQLLLFDPLRRYFLPLLPILAMGWWQATVWLHRRLPHPQRDWVFAAMLIVWLVPNVIRVGDFVIEQRATPFLEHYSGGKYVLMQPMIEAVQEHTEPEATIISSWGVSPEIGYFTRRRVIELHQVDLLDNPVPPLYFVGRGTPENRHWLLNYGFRLTTPLTGMITNHHGRGARLFEVQILAPDDPRRSR